MRTLFLVTLAALATAAQADTLNIGSLSLGGDTGILHLSGVTGLNDGTYYAGPFDASLNGGSTFRVFCADLLHETAFNANGTVLVQDAATLGAGYGKAAQIVNKFGASVGNDPVKNGALQAAIWTSIFPTVQYSDSTPGISSLAATYLATDLTGVSDHASYYNLGNGNQSMLGFSPQAVPEPTSVAALAVGAMGLLRRKRVR